MRRTTEEPIRLLERHTLTHDFVMSWSCWNGFSPFFAGPIALVGFVSMR